MSLILMTSAFTQLSEISQYESLSVTRSFYGVGALSLTLHPKSPGASLIEADTVLFLSDARHKAFLVEDVTRARDKLTVAGVQLKGVAKRRVCVPPRVDENVDQYMAFGWDRFTGDAESAYLHYAANNLTACEDTKRRFPLLTLATNQHRGASLPWQARFDKLDALFELIGKTTGLGWDVRPDFENSRYVFGCYQGTDRSDPAGTSLAVISEDMGNASKVTRKQAMSGSATTCYVGGAGEDENRLVLSVGNTAEGLSRRELWTEAGSVSDADMLTLSGQNKLSASLNKDGLQAELVDLGACRYERDYDLGDKLLVTMDGVRARAVLTEVTETYEAGTRTLKITLGDAPVTASELVTRLSRTVAR